MKSRRRNRSANRWAWNNSPEGLRNRRAKADARREALAATLPPIPDDPEPGSVWQTLVILGSHGQEMHRLTLYVPARGKRCDQHAGADGRLWTATDAGRWAAGHIAKRPSVAENRYGVSAS